ncbi:MAG TPA: FHA domain-containing serine/threonine-protein kinase [Bacteroidota bacterium]|nr:FHA domain-containing serine/threonine-protein kinase [Bacteroidota bacterium]
MNTILASSIERYDFSIQNCLGEGELGTVYKGYDVAHNQPVALKILKQQYGANEQIQRLFAQGMANARHLNHPNIVRIFEISGEDRKNCYIAMEYCRLGNVERLVRNRRRLTLPTALKVAMQICDVLMICHQAGVLHGNLKASNVLLRDYETPVLTDFRIFPEGLPDTLVQDISLAPYKSPECWQKNRPDASADLYSLGVLFYYLFTGTVPFSGRRLEDFERMHRFTAPIPPSRWRASVVKTLDDVVLHLLEKDPTKRIQSAQRVRIALKNIFEQFYDGIDNTRERYPVIYVQGAKKVIPVTQFPFRIGKGKSDDSLQRNHLVVGKDDPYVSSVHAVVQRFEGGFFFIDISKNGSWINGKKVHKQMMELLKENTILMGYQTRIVLKISGEAPIEPGSFINNHAVGIGIALLIGLMVLLKVVVL